MTPVLIAAASGRALAASARRGGYAPLVADFFGDRDTLDAAQAHARIADGLARGMDDERVMAALETLSAGNAPVGLVWGTGFEDRPDLLCRLARRWRLLGNTAETVAAIKDPVRFARLCADCDIPHPDTTLARPARLEGWLAKRHGGAGGTHIRPATDDDTRTGIYFQRHVAGTPVSIAFLADGQRVLALGTSAQWSAPTSRQPYRYGGAARPAPLSAPLEDALSDAVQRLTGAVPLVGLNSADFLVDGTAFHLLEINPRPGATLDIFEPSDGASLFALHVDACEGRLPERAPRYVEAAASMIVYSDREIRVTPRDWPAWTADRPHAGDLIGRNEPFCTVLAHAPTAAEARRLVEGRERTILSDAQVEAA